MKARNLLYVVAAAVMLAGCGSGQTTAPAASSAQAASSAPVTSKPTATAAPASTAAAWSPEAVTACRAFVNSGYPTMVSMAQSPLNQYRPGMTEAELSQANVGWGLASAGMKTSLPARLGQDAEPEVYQALSGVSVALANLSPIGPDGVEGYVKGMSFAFGNAIAICKQVGVIK